MRDVEQDLLLEKDHAADEQRRHGLFKRAMAVVSLIAVAGIFGAGSERVQAEGDDDVSPPPMAPGDVERIETGLTAGNIAIANITAINLGNGGAFLAAYEGDPSGGKLSSTVNTNNGAIRPNAAIVPADSEGMFNLRAGGVGDQYAVVDIVAELKANPYTEIFEQPERILDTRQNTSEIKGGVATRVYVGQENAGRKAIVNLTTATSYEASWSAIYPCSESYQNTSNINLLPGETRAILSLVEVDENGEICVLNKSDAIGQIADLLGYFDVDATKLERIVDTREKKGGTRTSGGQETGFKVGEPNSVVALNVTAVSPSSDGWYAVYSEQGGYGGTSNGNIFSTEYASGAFVLVKTDENGKVYVKTHEAMDADFVIDGVTLDPNDADGQVGFAGYLISSTPNRVYDGREADTIEMITNDGSEYYIGPGQVDINCKTSIYTDNAGNDAYNRSYELEINQLTQDTNPDPNVSNGDRIDIEFQVFDDPGFNKVFSSTRHADENGVVIDNGGGFEFPESAYAFENDLLQLTRYTQSGIRAVSAFAVNVNCSVVQG